MDDTQATLDKIYKVRQAGVPLEEIGSRLGISRQAVEEQLVKHYGSTEVYGLLTVAELLPEEYRGTYARKIRWHKG